MSVRRVARAHVALRWRLLRGAIRRGGADQVGAVATTLASGITGLALAIIASTFGRVAVDADSFLVVYCSVVLLAVLGFGVVAGIAQPIDPRVLAAEPLTDAERVAGMLAASTFGPAGLAGMVAGVGLVAGSVRAAGTAPVVASAVVAWLLSLLLVARTATNLLALLVNRFPRVGQFTVGLFGLVFYGLFQFVPPLLRGLSVEDRRRLADVLAWTPPGQLGRALGADGAGAAVAHLAVGALWVPFLLWGFARSTRALASSVRRGGGLDAAGAGTSGLGALVRRACGSGVIGTLAWRSLLVRFRTPRTTLEAVTGAGVGLAAVLVPALVRDTAGSGAVLVGGAVQLAVLFMSGNSFGSDGPALTHELLTGIEPRLVVAAKARSIAIVAAPLAAIGPLIAAGVTGEWRFLAAGFGVGVGALLAGTGAALVQSVLVPIAIPETDNPFVGGETGKGIVAATLLGLVILALAALTVPIALALIWASEHDDTALVTLFGVGAIIVGWLAMRVGVVLTTRRIAAREPEFVAAVTPAR